MPSKIQRTKKPITNRFKLLSALTWAALATLPTKAMAETTLTLSQAIDLTIKNHPKLRTFTYSKQVSDGLIMQAGATTPMTINAKVEDVMGSGDYSALSSMQTSLSISWLMEDTLIDARVGLANQQANLARYQQQLMALDVAAATARHFITLLSQQQQLQLAKLTQRKAKTALQQIIKRVNLGQLNAIDQYRAQAALAKKSLVVEDLIHEIQATKSQLAAQWQGDNEFSINGSLQNLPDVISLGDAYLALKLSPTFKQFAALRQSAQSEIALAKASAKPAWQLSVGFKRNEAIDDVGFNAGISIPFGGENRNQGSVNALHAQQRQNDADSEAWVQEISTELLLLTHKIKHNRHVITTLTQDAIPALEKADKHAEKAYNLGSLRYSEWVVIQQELIETQSELITAYTDIGLLNIELERLSGASISATH